MTFENPSYLKSGNRSALGSASSITPGLPSSLPSPSGGTLLAIVTSKNNAVHNCATGGWSKVDQVNSGASFTASIWKAAIGSGAPTFTWTGAAACGAVILAYDQGQSPGLALGTAISNTGSANPHSTAGGVTSTNNRSLFVYADASAVNTAASPPSGWAENYDSGSSTDASRHVAGSKAAATAAEDSGAISFNGGAAAWVLFQVEIYDPPGDADSHQVSKIEQTAFLEPYEDAVSFSKLEQAAIVEPYEDAASFSKIELSAWIEYPPVNRRRQPMLGYGFGWT